ncbi:MAG: hypothetical protein WCT07_02725 [Candidatus Paceibacterota bacterium]|jgi:cell shape-determining protein MreC
MTYLSDKSRKKKRYFNYGIYTCILIAFVYFWPSIQRGLYPFIEPTIVGYGESKSTITKIPSEIRTYFSSRSELSSQVNSLELTIEHLENELAEKNGIIKENNFIQTNEVNTSPSTLIMYPVMRDITTMYSSLLLSKGYKDGVEEKSLVYIRGRQPVCFISLVYDRTSLCKLLSAYGVSTDGVVASSSIILTLIGDGGGTFITNVARGTNISVGDTVFLASDPSMVLGNIVDINRDNQATAWRVYVRGMYNPTTSSVFYITK